MLNWTDSNCNVQLNISKKATHNSFYRPSPLVAVPVKELFLSPLNLSLFQQENTQTLGAARFKPSARFITEKLRYKTYHRNVIYNPSNIHLQRTRLQAN